jgi:hypothetical protein
MVMKFKLGCLAGLSLLMLATASAQARPLVYRLTAIADGALGTQSFANAVVTLTIRTDSRWVTSSTNASGALVYLNPQADVAVTIEQAGQTTLTTHINSGQLYTRYDSSNGVVSVGSKGMGDFYPFVIGCVSYPACNAPNYFLNSNDGVASLVPGVLAGLAADPTVASQESDALVALPANLSQPTVLHGWSRHCGVYDTYNECTGAPATPITTGDGKAFYVTDTHHGSGTAQFQIFSPTGD